MEPAAGEEWYSSSNTGEGEKASGQETAILLGEGLASVELGSVEYSGAISAPPAEDGERKEEERGPNELLDGIRGQIGQEMAGHLWHAGRQSTQRLINTYAHIDILRPYFDVEPAEFRDRLLRSFVPSVKISVPQEVSSELYGPTMLVFSLVAVLLYGMKTSGHVVEEGTLMGTAMVVCLGYWLGVSMVLFFLAYLFNAHFSLLQILSITGYSLTGHCTILLLSTAGDHYGSPGVFYPAWILIGGITAAKMVGMFMSRSWSLKDGLVLSSVAVVFHLLSILYLRLAYHRVYEVVAKVI